MFTFKVMRIAIFESLYTRKYSPPKREKEIVPDQIEKNKTK